MSSRREAEDDSGEEFDPEGAEEDEDYDANANKKKEKRKSAFIDDAAEDDDDDAVSRLSLPLWKKAVFLGAVYSARMRLPY